MQQITFGPYKDGKYIGLFESDGNEHTIWVCRPHKSYCAVGSAIYYNDNGGKVNVETKNGNLRSVENNMIICLDYESNKTNANQSFKVNYPEGVNVVVISDPEAIGFVDLGDGGNVNPK